jgi:hypothetical protein
MLSYAQRHDGVTGGEITEEGYCILGSDFITVGRHKRVLLF